MSLSSTSPAEFDFGTRLGILFAVESSAASVFAVSGVLLYITYSAVKLQPNAARTWSTETHVHYYFLNLMICDLILAIGGVLSIKWIVEAKVYPDLLCTIQGLLKHIGDVGVALSTLAIALHILQVFVLKKTVPPKVGLAMIWLVIAVLVIVPNAIHGGIYGPSGKWCWIDKGPVQEVALDYFWMWLAAALNIIAYVWLAIIIKRANDNFHPDQVQYPGLRGRSHSGHHSTSYRSEEHVSASQMLFYPLVYTIVVLPISATRFSTFTNRHVPFGALAFADTLFTSSGFLNTILYSLTRPQLLRRRTPDVPAMRILPERVRRDTFSPDFKQGRSYSISDVDQPSRISSI